MISDLPAAAAHHDPAPDLPAALPLLALLLAATLPTLLAFHQPPSSTVLNQCVAVALWGGVAMVVPPTGLPRSTWALHAALALMVLAVLGSWGLGSLPMSLALLALGLLAGAALMVATGASAAAHRTAGPSAFAAFAAGLLAAGVLGSGVALVQVFAPALTDGSWIAHSGLAGRAVGNLRQPNHLCSLLLWALVAGAALYELGRLPRAWAWGLCALMVFAIELTASRTGAVGLGLLLLWALIDRRLSPSARWLLACTPLLYALAYGAMAWWGDASHQALGAGARVAAEGVAADGADSPNSRLNIWRNALALIAANPVWGVGFGEFNFAWSLTAFNNRPTAFFDHTHSLALQLAVELGLPLASLVMALMACSLWQAVQVARRATGPNGVMARASLALVLICLLHSSVEYPLWYAYFLLPAALAWGFALGAPVAEVGQTAGDVAATPARSAARARPEPVSPPASRWSALAGLLMALGGWLALLDYQRAVVIYAPTEGSGSLVERIERGQHSLLFAHHADYAATTNDAPPAAAALGFARATHSLLDTRLMVAWAQWLADAGAIDPARWLAQRLREFHNPDADGFFAACKNLSLSAADFQCQPPLRVHAWREFLKPPLLELPQLPQLLPQSPEAVPRDQPAATGAGVAPSSSARQ